MTETNLKDLKDTARKILSYNRMQILNKHPFIGNIAMNLDLIPIRDARCSTAMTDGNSIYFDIDFLSRLSQDEIQFVLGHEIWHVVMLHFLRADKRDQFNFNIACDMEVNQILDNDGFLPPADAIFPNKGYSKICQYNFKSGLSAEEYYDELIKLEKKKMENGNIHEDYDKKLDKDSGKKGNGKNGKGKNYSGQFDKHFDQNEDQEKSLKEAMDKGASDKYGKKEADEEFKPQTIKNENEKREAAEKVREMVVSAAQTYERQKGDLPQYIKKYVDKLLESKMPWKEILSAFITKGFQNKTNWNTPNRRFAYQGTYLPSHDGDMMRIAVGIDTSGSCRNECKKFLSELNGITKSFDQYELHVIQCDTEVQNYTMYNESNPLNEEDKIEFKGFGGTKLHSIFDFIDLNNLDVDAAVIFTDGCCEKFDQNELFDLPIMWVLTGNYDSKNIQVGEKVKMKE